MLLLKEVMVVPPWQHINLWSAFIENGLQEPLKSEADEGCSAGETGLQTHIIPD
jgi:hypothetical protein